MKNRKNRDKRKSRETERGIENVAYSSRNIGGREDSMSEGNLTNSSTGRVRGNRLKSKMWITGTDEDGQNEA